MVNRLLSGVLHPLIHVGYGIQFDSPGMIVEGLSQSVILVECLKKEIVHD